MNPAPPAELNYKAELSAAMLRLSADPAMRFIGYGIRTGRAMGTLKGVPDCQLVETPVAENLMVGLAIGMALRGLRPLVFIERCDFLLNAADAIVNHLDKIRLMSHGEFAPAVLLRVVVGNAAKPLFTGATHTQDFTRAFAMMAPRINTAGLTAPEMIAGRYRLAELALGEGQSSMLVEFKDQI
jgi:hypothetical protein